MKSPPGIFIIIIIISSCLPPLPLPQAFMNQTFVSCFFPWKTQDCATASRPGLFWMTRFSLQGKPRKLILLCRERNSLTFPACSHGVECHLISLLSLFPQKSNLLTALCRFWDIPLSWWYKTSCVFFFSFGRLSRMGFCLPNPHWQESFGARCGQLV